MDLRPATRVLHRKIAVAFIFFIAGCQALAIFYNGAYFINAMSLCVAFMWIITIVALLYDDDGIRKISTYTVLGPTMAIVLLWLWTGLSMTWSITPGMSWIEFNRTGGYVAIFIIGAYLGDSTEARRLAPCLFLTVVSVSAVYAIGTKAAPTLVSNVNDLVRVSVPIGYTNTQGLITAMAFPVAVYLSVNGRSLWLVRFLAVLIAPVLLLSIFFTLSRGTVFALLVGIIMMLAMVRTRIRILGMLLLSFCSMLPVAIWSSRQPGLMTAGADLSAKVIAASSLRFYMLIMEVGVAALFIAVTATAKRVSLPSGTVKALRVLITAVAAISLTVILIIPLGSRQPLVWWLKDYYSDMRSEKVIPADAERLFYANSPVRWKIWSEALENWGDNPIGGTGAQSFPLVHLIRRDDGVLFVKQPHGLPFRLIAELGTVGFLLGALFIAGTLTLATRAIFLIRNRWDHSLAGTMITVMIIYLIHTSFDWDWNIFAVTMTYFMFSGLLVGWLNDKKHRKMTSVISPTAISSQRKRTLAENRA